MTAMRVSLAALGVALAAYGAFLLNHWQTPAQLVGVGEWAVAGVILHDGLIAPVAIACGWLARRGLPERTRARVMVGFVLIGTLAVSGFAVLTRSHGGGDNHTLLDRNYPVGLLIASVVIVACLVLGSAAGRVRGVGRRRNKVPE